MFAKGELEARLLAVWTVVAGLSEGGSVESKVKASGPIVAMVTGLLDLTSEAGKDEVAGYVLCTGALSEECMPESVASGEAGSTLLEVGATVVAWTVAVAGTREACTESPGTAATLAIVDAASSVGITTGAMLCTAVSARGGS